VPEQSEGGSAEREGGSEIGYGLELVLILSHEPATVR